MAYQVFTNFPTGELICYYVNKLHLPLTQCLVAEIQSLTKLHHDDDIIVNMCIKQDT